MKSHQETRYFCNSLIFGANIKTVTNLTQVTVTMYTASEHKTEAFYTDIYLVYKISTQVK